MWDLKLLYIYSSVSVQVAVQDAVNSSMSAQLGTQNIVDSNMLVLLGSPKTVNSSSFVSASGNFCKLRHFCASRSSRK